MAPSPDQPVHLPGTPAWSASNERGRPYHPDGADDPARFRIPDFLDAGTETFNATCLICHAAFTYQAPAIRLGSSEPRPAFGPVTVCTRKDCVAKREAAAADVQREQAAADAEQFAIQRRTAFVETVPPLYHVNAQPGTAASTAHIVPALEGWTFDQSLYLYGPSSSGKSHQVACLLLRVAGRKRMAWFSSRRLVAEKQASIGSKGRVPSPWILDNPCVPDVLVLNDLFAERATEYSTVEIVGILIDTRYDAGLPVVATGNFTLAEAAAKSEDPTVRTELVRIAERLLEMTSPPRGIRLKLDAVNWRERIADGLVQA